MGKRLLSLLLAVLMVFGSADVNVFANEISKKNIRDLDDEIFFESDNLLNCDNNNEEIYANQMYAQSNPEVINGVSGVVAGKIRYVSQNPNGPNYHSQYWTGVSNPSWQCNLAAHSMALSYLGIDYLPKDLMSTGYNIGGEVKYYKNNASLANMLSYYFNNGDASPVILHFERPTYPSSGKEHWMIIDGYVGGNTYRVQDPWDNVVKTVTVNGDLVSGNTGSGYFSSVPERCQYYYKGANIDSINTCWDVDSKYNIPRYDSASNKITIQGWGYSTKGNKVTFKAKFDNGTTVNLNNVPSPDVKQYTPCTRDDARFSQSIDVSFLSPNANHSVTVTAYSSTGMSKTVGSYSFKTSNFVVTTNNAKNVTNTNATISGTVSPSGTVSSWGFYYGEGSDLSKKAIVSNSSTSTSSLSCDMATYAGKLDPGKIYSYKIWIKSGNTELVSKTSKTFTTTNEKPGEASIVIPDELRDIGTDITPVITWKSVLNADSYSLQLRNIDGDIIQEARDVDGTQYAFNPISVEGDYYITIKAVNEAGEGEEGRSDTIITVHPDVTVTFKDYDDQVISRQTIPYGSDAMDQPVPEREGHKFIGWSDGFKSVKKDVDITAKYEINHYKVVFKDENGNIISEQMVDYGADAIEPDYKPTLPEYILYGWDKNTKNIKEDTITTAVVGWYNENFPIYIKPAPETIAQRNFEGKINEGYEVSVKFKNWEQSTTRGRIIVALKTDEGKLLTTTESSAFSIKKDAEKTIDIFVPYDGAASKAYIYAVERYSDMIPISSEVVVDIDQGLAWSDWSEEEPPADAIEIESRKEYRYSEKQLMTSYDTSIAGWTQVGSDWVKSGSGTVDYAKSWPGGFDTGNSYYSHYKKTPPTNSETATSKRTTSTYIDHYLYYHWCRGSYSGGPINRRTSTYYTGEFHCFHAFVSGANSNDNPQSDGSIIYSNANCCRDSYWYYKIPIYRTSYTDYKKQFKYEKWSDYSEWNPVEISGTDSRKVETRTACRYKSGDFIEDNSGETITISGNIGDGYKSGNKLDAILTVYKVDSASDYTTECVAQGEIDEDGTYSFDIKLKEEPTPKTGDFTVTLGIEGADKAIEIDPIKAPASKYTVRFLDYDGSVLSEQEVNEGDTAKIPDKEPSRDGYIFRRWSLSNTNIKDNTDIVAEYIQKTYHVVFVDWNSNKVVEEEHYYGDPLIPPVPGNVDESVEASWDKIDEGITTISSNMVVCTRYTPRKCEVKILDKNYDLVSTQNIDYGTSPDFSVVSLPENGNLMWSVMNEEAVFEDMANTLITEDVVIRAVENLDVNVIAPTSDIDSGEYSHEISVSLQTGTEDATIYYTTDGTIPTPKSSKYSGPIVISDTTVLKYYAVKDQYGDSSVSTNYYVINSPDNQKEHLVTVVKGDSLFNEYYIVKDGEGFSIENIKPVENGYLYGLYKDDTFENEWHTDNIINESMKLYALFKANEFSVIFVDIDDELLYKESVPFGCESAAPIVPEIEGYKAIGWDNEDYKCVTKDLIVRPVYVLSDGSNDGGDTIIELDRQEASLAVGETCNIFADVNRDGCSLTWRSDDNSVARVSQYGKVTATGVGSTIIRASVNGTDAYAECKVNVLEGLITKQKKDISKLFETTDNIAKYVVVPSASASITSNGILTTKKDGIIAVTAKRKIGTNYVDIGTVSFVVKTPKLSNIKAVKKTELINLNQHVSNTLGVEPVWSVPKNCKVASVDEKGMLEVKKSGSVTLTATFGEGSNAAKYTCKLTANIPNISKSNVELKLNETDEKVTTVYDYMGEEIKPFITVMTKGNNPVELIQGVDYSVEYKNNINVGTSTIIFTGINDYEGTIKKTFKIKAVDLKKASQSTETQKAKVTIELDGSPYKINNTNKYGISVKVNYNGKLLVENVDYTLSFKNNTATSLRSPEVVIKGKKNFTNSVTIPFNITE